MAQYIFRWKFKWHFKRLVLIVSVVERKKQYYSDLFRDIILTEKVDTTITTMKTFELNK